MSNFITKENSFSRSLDNVAKMGAYYTDKDHCRRIGMLFNFDAADEICVLEPSIGDASAVKAVLGKKKDDNKKIFGVELNTLTYEEHLKANEDISYCLNADFLSGVKISHAVFSFCFANPPYGESKDMRERYEKLFLEKLIPYMKVGAYIAYVIPSYVFAEERFLRLFLSKFDFISSYRFDDKVYQQFKQIVVIGRKKGSFGYLKSAYEELFLLASKVDEMPYLPTEEVEKEKQLVVSTSFEKDMTYFAQKNFDKAAALDELKNSSLTSVISLGFPKKYRGTCLSNPVLPLKKDLAYLCAVTGGGEGLTGSEEDGDLHLQRGVAKIERTSEVKKLPSGEYVEIENSHTVIKLNIISNDQLITLG